MSENDKSGPTKGALDLVQRSKKRIGFAAMPRERVREIAALGGVAAHENGTAHEFTREEAREAERKGGKATWAKKRLDASRQTLPLPFPEEP
jgi:general stress protein YciG